MSNTLTIYMDDYYYNDDLDLTLDFRVNSSATFESNENTYGYGYLSERLTILRTVSDINYQSLEWSIVGINVYRSGVGLENIIIENDVTIDVTNGISFMGSPYVWEIVIWKLPSNTTDNIENFAQFGIGSNSTVTISDMTTDSPSITGHETSYPFTIITSSFPERFIVSLMINTSDGFNRVLTDVNDNCLASFTRIPCLIYDKQLDNKCLVLSKIENVKEGNEVITNIGNQKICKIMKSTSMTGKCEYVKFSTNCFGNNIPCDDVYMTKAHPLSLGYFKTEYINNGIKDESQSDKVFVHIESYRLLNKLDGIELVEIEDNANYNLIFDNHCSIDVCGLDVVTHHPIGNNVFSNPKLKKDDFIDYKRASKKKDKPFYLDFESLMRYKPDSMNLKTFLRRCFIYDINEKFKFIYIDKNDNILKNHFRFE